MKRESLKLTKERREALVAIAESVGALNERGIDAGKPSWRALVYAIADGKVRVERVGVPSQLNESVTGGA